eukprot:5604711-Prymnesium_polylepis.1
MGHRAFRVPVSIRLYFVRSPMGAARAAGGEGLVCVCYGSTGTADAHRHVCVCYGPTGRGTRTGH